MRGGKGFWCRAVKESNYHNLHQISSCGPRGRFVKSVRQRLAQDHPRRAQAGCLVIGAFAIRGEGSSVIRRTAVHYKLALHGSKWNACIRMRQGSTEDSAVLAHGGQHQLSITSELVTRKLQGQPILPSSVKVEIKHSLTHAEVTFPLALQLLCLTASMTTSLSAYISCKIGRLAYRSSAARILPEHASANNAAKWHAIGAQAGYPSFFGCESDATVGRESIADTAGAGAHSAPARWSCGSRRHKYQIRAPPHGPPFFAGLGGREAKNATEPESFGPSNTCSCSHASMCYTTCFGEQRRKMACDRCTGGIPFFFRVRIRRNRRSRIHRRHSRSGGAFCTRPAPPPPESDGTQKAMWISSAGAAAVAYWVDAPAW